MKKDIIIDPSTAKQMLPEIREIGYAHGLEWSAAYANSLISDTFDPFTVYKGKFASFWSEVIRRTTSLGGSGLGDHYFRLESLWKDAYRLGFNEALEERRRLEKSIEYKSSTEQEHARKKFEAEQAGRVSGVAVEIANIQDFRTIRVYTLRLIDPAFSPEPIEFEVERSDAGGFELRDGGQR